MLNNTHLIYDPFKTIQP